MRQIGLIIAGVAMAGLAQGALKIPSHVMDVSELAEAKAKAEKDGKALTFVYMDPGSSWGSCIAASLVVFDKMRSKSVIVFVAAKDGSFEKSPVPVQRAIADPALGSWVPRLAVFDPKVETKFGTMSYAQINEGPKGFREITKAIKEGMGGAVGGGLPAASALAPRWNGVISDGEQEDWKSAAGTKIRAQAVRFDGAKLSLMKPDGKTIQVTLKQLDASSQAHAQELIDAAKAGG